MTMTVKASSFRAIIARMLATIMIVLGIAASFMAVDVDAASIDWGTAVPITQNGQVVDSITVNGKTVESVYAPRSNIAGYDSDTTYCCAAFVKKFYKSVYGVDVWNLCPGNQPSVSSGSFSKTSSPKVGDIAGNPGHWAIVKSVNGSAVTVIEQNAWNSKFTSAMVGRTLYEDSGYWYWRWSGNDAKASSSKSSSKSSAKSTSKSTASKQQVKSPFSFNIQSTKVYANNAVIYTKVNNPSRLQVKQVGCKIYDASGKLLKTQTESCSRNESVFNIWYDINAELGMTLKSNTTYKYKFFVDYGGARYICTTQSFRTR